MPDVDDRAQVYALIFDLSTRLQVLMDRELAADGLTAKQWYLILNIARSNKEAVTLGELAGMAGTSRQNVKQIALKLERRGFLRLSVNPADKRSLRLSVTDACRTYFRNRAARDVKLLAMLFQPIDTRLWDLKNALTTLDHHFAELQETGSLTSDRSM